MDVPPVPPEGGATTRAHPFPPVVRWALFPALAAIAGAAGGALGASLAGEMRARLIVIGGTLSAGAGLATMLSTRRSVCLVLAPLLGVLGASTGVAVVEALERGAPIDPWEMLSRILRDLPGLFLVGWVPLAQTMLHRTTLIRGWRPALALGLGFGVLTFGIVATLAPRGVELLAVASMLALSTLAQIPAVAAAKAVASRFRPEAA